MTEAEVRLQLLTRTDCHLCDVAKAALDRIARPRGLAWAVVDVDSDPRLQERYWDRVPVILLDGREHSFYRVDEQRLLHDLEASVA